MSAKVSVIIPIYNVEEFLEECLVSVINQTLKEIEIICVDDGTPDHSMDIVERYAKEDDRIVILHKENGGLSSARNAGLAVAAGEYVYFIDSDDYILEDTLKVLYEECKRQNLDTIFFDAESFFENEELAEQQKNYANYYIREDIYGEVVSGQQLFMHMLNTKAYRSSACMQMNRRMLLEENNLRFREGLIHEDELFTMQILLRAQRTRHVAQPFYMRRIREDSIMTNVNAMKSSYGYFKCANLILPEIAELVHDDEVLAAFENRIAVLRKNAIAHYKKVEDEGMYEKLIGTDIQDKIMFQAWVKDYCDITTENKSLRKRIQKMEKSTTWKVGKKITLIPRQIKNQYLAVKKKNNTVKVSIIIPVYNAEKYLRQCINSLRGQTLKSIEIICVDDGSTDRSLKLLQGFARKDYRIKIYQQDHKGAGAARNLGIEKASGEYLLFLDSDDYFEIDLCHAAYTRAKEKDAEIVLFTSQGENMQTGEIARMQHVLRYGKLPKERVFAGTDVADRLFQTISNAPWSKLFSREYILKNNLRFQDLHNCNDAYFVRIALAMAKRIVTLNKVLVTYRYNMDVSTQSGKSREPLEFYKAMTAIREKLEQENMFEIYRSSYLNWALSDTLSNYNTVSEEAKQMIKEKMLSEGFTELEIDKLSNKDIKTIKATMEYRALLNDEM